MLMAPIHYFIIEWPSLAVAPAQYIIHGVILQYLKNNDIILSAVLNIEQGGRENNIECMK